MLKLLALIDVVASLLFVPFAHAAIGPVGTLRIVNENLAPDGFNRTVITAGGRTPGVLIKGNKGDRFRINVVNDLTDPSLLKSTSIHWHGLLQHGTNWADGAAFVTQCPISPSKSFEYKFAAEGQAGTYWYHSHVSTQYCDGLRGPLVIYDPFDPLKFLYDVDNGNVLGLSLLSIRPAHVGAESTVITLTDWYHLPAPQLPIPPTPDSTLINGLGRYPGGPTSPLAVITVQRGKRYRFRLVSMSCDPNYQFSIDNHPLTVIEADGESTQPLRVDTIPIFASQRYSFVLNANQPVGNYWIRALPNIGTRTFDGGLNSAILRYVGAPVQDPTTTANASPVVLQEVNLHPLFFRPAPGIPVIGQADVNLQLNFTFAGGRFAVNGVSFEDPPVPVLLQILHGSQNAQDLLPAGAVYTLPHNKVVELRMPGGVIGGGHPLHLHGHTFWVVRSAGSTTTNFLNPVLRDTVNIGGLGDDVTIRFKTDNPGPWFLHCHIDFHLVTGFAVVFAEAPNRTASANPVPPAWDELCPLYNALPEGDK